MNSLLIHPLRSPNLAATASELKARHPAITPPIPPHQLHLKRLMRTWMQRPMCESAYRSLNEAMRNYELAARLQKLDPISN
ncbi:MAG: hypothetical protein ABIR54_22340 [Burkholderiaceae bacterium]